MGREKAYPQHFKLAMTMVGEKRKGVDIFYVAETERATERERERERDLYAG